MNSTLQKTIDDFCKYLDEYKQYSWLSSNITDPICAYLFLLHHEEPNREIVDLCKKIIDENSGVFSSFRGSVKPIYACILATDSNPGDKMALANAAYDALRNNFSASSALALLAFVMAEIAKPSRYYDISLRTKILHQELNKVHPVLTDFNDVTFIGLLAMTSKKDENILIETEAIYNAMKDEVSVFYKDVSQNLAFALTLCQGNPNIKIENTLTLLHKLNENRLRVTRDYTLVSLGILANLKIPLDKLSEDIVDTYHYLKKRGNYGIFGYGKSGRLQHSLMIVAAHYMNANIELLSAIIVNAIIQIQVQQAAASSAASAA